jgi:hypothetical protein
MAVVGDGDDARFFQRADGREFLARDIFVMAPVTKTFTTPSRAARSRMSATVPELSIAGEVLGMQTTEVNPPRAAAAVPVARFSLAVWPGSRKWTCKSIRPGQTIFPLASKISIPPGRGKIFADGGNFSVNDENVRRGIKMICGINHPSAGQKQRIHRREHSARRLTRQARGSRNFGLAAPKRATEGGRSSMVERQFSKLLTRVRFPSPAPFEFSMVSNRLAANTS